MSSAVEAVVIAVSLLVGGGTVLLALLDRRPLSWLLGGLVAVEAAALAQVLIAVVVLLGEDGPRQPVTFAGYALASLLVPPVGAVWALSDKTKWGTAAAGVSSLVLAVVTLRMRQVWG